MSVGKRGIGILAAGVVVLAVAATAYGFGGRSDGSAQPDAGELTTVEVARMTLVDYEDAVGEIGFGEVLPLRYVVPPPAGAQPPPAGEGDEPGEGGDGALAEPADPPGDQGLGLVTWLPAVGSTVDRGEAVLRVDDEPVVLLFGALPLYRPLGAGMSGADVKQFEENLIALGYTGFTVDDTFTPATATIVRRWQRDLGLQQTGSVAPGEVLYAAGPIRVAEHRIRVGDVAGGDILGYTGSTRTVTAAVSTRRMRTEIVEGASVTVLLPDGVELPATVVRVAPPPGDAGAPDDASTVLVEAAVDDPAALDGRQGQATVRFVAHERRDVLAVPVTALVALAEGGYGVQVVDDAGDARYVAVRTGLFARGYVEIVSGDLRAGDRVVVP